MKQPQLSRKGSIIFVAAFAFITLATRFWLETAFAPPFWLSFGIGAILLGILFALIRVGFLRFSDTTE